MSNGRRGKRLALLLSVLALGLAAAALYVFRDDMARTWYVS
jgi:hypothetical protein